MYTGRILFAQLLDFLPTYEFHTCVRRYQGHRRVRRFSCREQFLCMVFAQLTYRESLRDIETCLRAPQPKRYHAGIRATMARSTLADANERRDWRIDADCAQVLIARARQLYAGDAFGVAWTQTAYVFDSTTIDLCLTLFPWGALPPAQGGCETPYAARSARQHAFVPSHDRWHHARCHRPRPVAPGARRVLRDGSRLHRLPAPVGHGPEWRVLRGAR